MKPGFDFWTTFFSLAAGCGIAMASYLLQQSKATKAFRWLAIIVFLFAVMIFEWVLWWTGYIERWQMFKGISIPFPSLIGVLLLGYYRSAFPKKVGAPSLKHYIPFVLIVIKFLPAYLFYSGIKVKNWGSVTMLDELHDVAIYLMYLHFSIYPIWIYMNYRVDFRADRDLSRWHQWLLASYAGIVASYWIHHTLSLWGWMNPRLDFFIAFLIVLFMALVAWLGAVHQRILAGIPFETAILPKKYQKSALKQELAEAIGQRIKTLFENEQLHLDPDLNLDELARRAGASRHHVSQVLNEQFGMSFADWVNSQRVETAKGLLLASDDLIVKEVAYRAGFNTKAAFNLVFKKWTGISPSAFRLASKNGQKSSGN